MQAHFNPQATLEPAFSWDDLPAEVRDLLSAAANTWEDTAQSEADIYQALAIAGGSLDVLVAAYRYFFYKHNDAAALQMAMQVVEQTSRLAALPDEWELRASILSQRKEDALIRLYLNTYAASGLVLARMGAIEEAKVITARVSEIDDKREFGAATVFHILTHPDDEEED
jgi:hypothetical protein